MLRRILEIMKPVKKRTIDSGGKTLLGEILVMTNKCTREQVLGALDQQKAQEGRMIGNILMEDYEISQDDISEALEIQSYLREDRCANKSMEKLIEAARNFMVEKENFRESIHDMQSTLDKVNGTANNSI
jgi:hypothetical protein